jgi:dihydrolipoamide dehydrogenase
MKNYDAVIIGSGCGAVIAQEAAEHGLKVAMIERGPLGGTCLNLGCIPSKMLIHPADRIMEIREAAKLGIEADIKAIDFQAVMQRMRRLRNRDQRQFRAGVARLENLHLYEGTCRFTGERLLEVNGQQIKGKKVYIACGSRPLVPAIRGLDSVPYLTSDTLLELKELPPSLIIIGGGYVAAEYAHFFAAMGSSVTILEMADRLLLNEEPEISVLLKKNLSRRMEVHTGTRVVGIKPGPNGVTVLTTSPGGRKGEYMAHSVLVAAGRQSNADTLGLKKGGIQADKRGYITVNRALETSSPDTFAVGDVLGRYMFKHMADEEAMVAAQNLVHKAGLKVNYSAVPHAVFSHPQIASVGLTEAEARKKGEVAVAATSYFDTARGTAMMENEGFAKVVLKKETAKILGFHIIGPSAPELIQEVVNAMSSRGHGSEIMQAIHIHPALSELIPAALAKTG